MRWINSRVTGHIKDAAPEWAAKILKILQTDGCIYTDVKISLCVAEKDAHCSFVGPRPPSVGVPVKMPHWFVRLEMV